MEEEYVPYYCIVSDGCFIICRDFLVFFFSTKPPVLIEFSFLLIIVIQYICFVQNTSFHFWSLTFSIM